MLKNLWDKVEFYCCNHNEPQLMYEYPSNTPFYACRRYMRKDTLHPDGHEDNEPSCTNRLSYYAAASVLEKLNELIEAEMDDDCFGDYTDMAFVSRGMRIRILDFTDRNLKLGVQGMKEALQWKNNLM